MGKSSEKKNKAHSDLSAGGSSSEDVRNPYDALSSLKSLIQRTRNFKFYLAGSISLITFLVYLSSLQNEFVEWDDGSYIFRNPFIGSFNLTFLRWAFSDFSTGSWHPLTWISHALDYAIWGLNPLGHHLTNVVLHSANTFMVVVLVTRLVSAWKGEAMRNGQSIFLNEWAIFTTAGVTGLLFGLHPLHVESVAWVSERKDLLCALFFLLSVTMYSKYEAAIISEKGLKNPISRLVDKHYLLSVGFFIFALLSKPMSITLPVVLLILDWYPYRRISSLKTFGTAFAEKLPFVVLSAILSMLTFQTQSLSSAVGIIRLPMQLTVAARSFAAYLWKMVVPLNLSPFYPYPHPDDVSLLSVNYFLPIAIAIGITMACVGISKKRKLWLAVWSYYVITLLPVVGIIQVGSQSMADRYTYLPSIGPFLIFGLAVASTLGKANIAKKWRQTATFGSIFFIIFIFISIAYLSVRQIGIWRNSITLWSYVIQKDPEGVPLAYNQRGKAFEEMGLLDKALADFNMAIALDPFFDKAYLNLGILYRKAGLYDKAIELFSWYITLDPRNESFLLNRGLSYYDSGQYENALADFDKAISINKNNTFAYFDRGNIHLKIGNKEQAILDFKKACDLGDKRGCVAMRNVDQPYPRNN